MATEFDPLRYGGWASDAYAESKIGETYSANNAVSYPHENRPAGRDAVAHPPGRAALLEALRQHGALCSFSNSGVEAPIVVGTENLQDGLAVHIALYAGLAGSVGPLPAGLSFSEDCLSLNVYRPVTHGSARLPVLLYIHGGGFTLGGGALYNGSALARMNQAIVVTI